MSATRTVFRSARPIFQTRAPFSAQTQNAFARSTARAGRRFQSTDAPAAEAATKSWAAQFWASPVGPKTVHFWAPVMKWCLVLAGVSDFYRPAEKLSVTQNVALTATGAIWTRWCLIIKPRNVLLASVNFCLGCVGVVQLGRIFAYNQGVKKQSPGQQIEAAKDSIVATAEGVKDDAKTAVSS